jgi:hypothetical protein
MNHKKAYEVAMLGGALVMSLASFGANAATGCSAGTGSTVTGATTTFVKTTFAPKCSASTVVNYIDGGSDFAVQGASIKGKMIYGAGTAGGQVTACSTVASGSPAAGTPASATGSGC